MKNEDSNSAVLSFLFSQTMADQTILNHGIFLLMYIELIFF